MSTETKPETFTVWVTIRAISYGIRRIDGCRKHVQGIIQWAVTPNGAARWFKIGKECWLTEQKAVEHALMESKAKIQALKRQCAKPDALIEILERK
jgi:hypothetical protein